MKKALFIYAAALLCAASCNDKEETAFPGRTGSLVATDVLTGGGGNWTVRTDYGYDKAGRTVRIDREKAYNNLGSDFEAYGIDYSGKQVHITGTKRTEDLSGYVSRYSTVEYTIQLNDAGRMVSGTQEGHSKILNGSYPASYIDFVGPLTANYDAQGLPLNFTNTSHNSYHEDPGMGVKPSQSTADRQTQYNWRNGRLGSTDYSGKTYDETFEHSKWHDLCTYDYTNIRNTTNTDFTDIYITTLPDILSQLRLMGDLCPYVPEHWGYTSSPGTDTQHSTVYGFEYELDKAGRIVRVVITPSGGQPYFTWEFTYKE